MTRTQPQILAELIHALTQAAGGASQLTHQLQDPRFMMISEAIELTKEACTNLAVQSIRVAPYESKKTIVL